MLYRRLGGTHRRSWRNGEQKNLSLMSAFELRLIFLLVCSPVSLLTTIARSQCLRDGVNLQTALACTYFPEMRKGRWQTEWRWWSIRYKIPPAGFPTGPSLYNKAIKTFRYSLQFFIYVLMSRRKDQKHDKKKGTKRNTDHKRQNKANCISYKIQNLLSR
jgi:hypothetical protein